MKQNSFLNKGILRAVVCLLLCTLIVLSLILPGMDLDKAEPANPMLQDIDEISVLSVGDNISQLNTVMVPSGGSTPPTVPMETSPDETNPEQTEPNETIPQETDAQQPDIDQGDEGNEDGNQGEEGGEYLELDLGAVLTWYKYGKEPKTITCAPDNSVTKALNTAQLVDMELKYGIRLTGSDAKYVEITSVTIAEGDAAQQPVEENGKVLIGLPGGTGKRNYTFHVSALAKKKNDDGKLVEQEVTFDFVLRCEYTLDLELKLTWENKEGNKRDIVCAPDKAEAFAVRNYDLKERVLKYTTVLSGTLAEDAEIVDVRFDTLSGHYSGSLEKNGGTLILNTVPGSNTETYYLTFTVKTPERSVVYTYHVVYQEMLDVQLAFTWRDKAKLKHSMTCMPGGTVSDRIKNNQLSAGAIAYSMELQGKDSADGRIMGVSYSSENGNGSLEEMGSLPISMPDGATTNTYRIAVDALVSGQQMKFEIVLHYANDVLLQMEYTVNEDGMPSPRSIACENGKRKTTESIYNDQLVNDILSYEMSIVGSDGKDVSITAVSCFQSGTGKSITLSESGDIALKLDEGKTGDNAFMILAQDDGGNEYTFEINIPYKPRGTNAVEITTNLVDGQQIPNGVKTNLTVKARSFDSDGNTIEDILANGSETKLIVKLDGVELSHVSASGVSTEYDMVPSNPEKGDTNEHVLEIYAEDSYGNADRIQLKLIGERRQPGHQIGTATIYVDMTVLGLGVTDAVKYDVLAYEPISYVIAKAVLGEELPEPYGKARETLGWSGSYEGTLDSGFYLQSLTTGLTANALEGKTWPGSNEKEVLAAIDDRFRKGTGLATLWRCLYRNGLDKSTGSGMTFGEFDYTSGSGWMYSVGGTTYYPGQSMSAVYLQDGDVLTLRFTLAQGWDVGGGDPGYSNTVGYCVSAVNGGFRISHKMKTEILNGKEIRVCSCCGLEETCAHADTEYKDQENGTHVKYCNDCDMAIGDWEDHTWGEKSTGNNHVCTVCGAEERHFWIETENTATCDTEGESHMYCDICLEERVETAEPKGHAYNKRWISTDDNTQHYQQCTRCDEPYRFEDHRYVYEPGWGDYQCATCEMFHGILGLECPGDPEVEGDSTCQKMHYICSYCGCELFRTGSFEEYHEFGEDGLCVHCNARDPDYAFDDSDESDE